MCNTCGGSSRRPRPPSAQDRVAENPQAPKGNSTPTASAPPATGGK